MSTFIKTFGYLLLFSVFLSACSLSKGPVNSFESGKYRNLFDEYLGKSDAEVQEKIDAAWQQLFYGDDDSRRVYYPIGKDMAYIEDIGNADVRSEGMSYGMMITVQMDKKEEFDRLWKWAKTYMQHTSGPRKNYFAWQCKINGQIIDPNSASDGEEWIVMALFFAAGRWGKGQGIFDYQAEAQAILEAMLDKEAPDQTDNINNMFNLKEKQIVFVPLNNVDDFTDPSYHLPHFYELWALWADKNNDFWYQAAQTSREFLKKTTNPQTGLAPDYAHFNGEPMVAPWGGGHDVFRYDAWRVAMNIAVDYVWFAKDEWEVSYCNRLLNFFHSQGIEEYGDHYTLDGKKLTDDHSTGLIAMNAVACLASTNDNRIDFLKELWNIEIPEGGTRYYNALLYMLALLQLSGNFQIYDPTS